MPITVADLLYGRVLPFYVDLGVPVQAVFTDNGRDFCGPAEHHPYELMLAPPYTGPPSADQRLRRTHEPHAV